MKNPINMSGTGYKLVLCGGFALIAALLIYLIGDYVTAEKVMDVTATVTDRVYHAEWLEQKTDYVTTYDAKGQPNGSTPVYSQVYHPPEYHVIWRWHELSYDGSFGPDYGGYTIGAGSPFVVYRGGWSQRLFLSPR